LTANKQKSKRKKNEKKRKTTIERIIQEKVKKYFNGSQRWRPSVSR
jgi:hypothetical protein